MSVEEDPIELDDAIELDADDLEEVDGDPGPSKIQTFARGGEHQDMEMKRAVNADGTGATRCKTFHSKLRVDALEFLDDQVNQWLDDHPEYEVKFVTTTIGVLTGKAKEEALFMNVWV